VHRPPARQATTAFDLANVNHSIEEDASEIRALALGKTAEVELPKRYAGFLYHVVDGGRELVGGDRIRGVIDVRLELAADALENPWIAAILDQESL
jgi:hypothetical protein